jgi:hypothetical protein
MRAEYLCDLAHHFHLTPRDVDNLYLDEFEAFVGSAKEIRKEAAKK